jgi:hypothetical protein
MTLPTIHLNGTSQEALIDDARTAYSALDEAVKALCRMHPHGRDYYPVPGTWDAASDEHDTRIQAVQGVMSEIGSWAKQVSLLQR